LGGLLSDFQGDYDALPAVSNGAAGAVIEPTIGDDTMQRSIRHPTLTALISLAWALPGTALATKPVWPDVVVQLHGAGQVLNVWTNVFEELPR
jgi:hypothetical protein